MLSRGLSWKSASSDVRKGQCFFQNPLKGVGALSSLSTLVISFVDGQTLVLAGCEKNKMFLQRLKREVNMLISKKLCFIS